MASFFRWPDFEATLTLECFFTYVCSYQPANRLAINSDFPQLVMKQPFTLIVLPGRATFFVYYYYYCGCKIVIEKWPRINVSKLSNDITIIIDSSNKKSDNKNNKNNNNNNKTFTFWIGGFSYFLIDKVARSICMDMT